MKNRIFLLILFLVGFTVSAQGRMISGVVTDSEGQALPGVNIIVKETKKGTQTDFDGKYSISAYQGQTLVFNYIGFKSKTVKIGFNSTINVQLEEDVQALEEVVIMGYGVKSERSITYSVSEVVEGKAAGVSIGDGTDSKRLNNYKSGTLTAGEINDIESFDEWKKIICKKEFEKIKKDWGFQLEEKLLVTVKDKNEKAIANAKVSIYSDSGNSTKPKMTTRTDVFGKTILFKDQEYIGENNYYYVQVFHNGSIFGKKIKSNQKEVNFKVDGESNCKNLDIMFTIDATGSMGDEMEYLKEELRDIIGRIDNTVGEKRIAMTFYRDQGDEYVVRDFDFTSSLDEAQVNLDNQFAGGGGDYEEAVEMAMKVSMSKSWNTNAHARLMFLLLDAPPHLTEANVEMIHQQIKIAQANGIKIIPVVASGADKTVEMLMRFFSISTNGTYVFLTDDSGVGNPHLKPSTSKYRVEKLNDLIVRLIKKYSNV